MEALSNLYSANEANIARIYGLLSLVQADPDPELRRVYVDKLNPQLVSAQQFAEWLLSSQFGVRPNIAQRRKPRRQKLVVDKIEAEYREVCLRREYVWRRLVGTQYHMPTSPGDYPDYMQDNRYQNSIISSTMSAPAEGSSTLSHRPDGTQEARIPGFQADEDGPGGRFFVLEPIDSATRIGSDFHFDRSLRRG